MFFQGIVAFCLALSGARLVTAAPHLNARQEYTFASVGLSCFFPLLVFRQCVHNVFAGNLYSVRGIASIQVANG